MALARVDFTGIEDNLDDAEAAIVNATRDIRKRQITKLLDVGEDIFQSRKFERLEGVTVPYKSELARLFQGVLWNLFRQQRELVQREFKQAGTPTKLIIGPPNDPRSVQRFLGVRAKALSALLSQDMGVNFMWEMLAELSAGRTTLDRDRMERQMAGLSERKIRNQAQFSTSEAANLGRQSAAEELEDEVSRAIFTSVLDGGSCPDCRSVDGAEVKVGSDKYLLIKPPLKECDGRGRCRCVFVFVMKSEEEGFIPGVGGAGLDDWMLEGAEEDRQAAKDMEQTLDSAISEYAAVGVGEGDIAAFRQSVEDFYAGLPVKEQDEWIIRRLGEGINEAPQTAGRVFRGIRADGPLPKFNVGDELDFPIASFTTDYGIAETYAPLLGEGGEALIFDLESGAGGLTVGDLGEFTEEEIIMGGRFRVTSVSQREGRTIVGLRWIASLALPGGIPVPGTRDAAGFLV